MSTISKSKQRIDLIKKLGSERHSKILTYITIDRPPFNTQIAGDAIRIARKHLDVIGEQETIGLFLYSMGGHMVAPLRLCRLIREYCKKFEVIVPFHALSAGTLICLGADVIVMGKSAELSPIDPSTGHPYNPVDPSDPKQKKRLEISVEDLTSYFQLAKEKADVRDEQMVQVFNELANKIHPLAIGNVYRGYRMIRELAKKLLLLHMDKSKDETRIEEIIKKLTAELCIHGYLITRDEAKKDINLNVEMPSEEVEKLMWSLYEEYEKQMELTTPFNPIKLLKDKQSITLNYPGAYIESEAITDTFIYEVAINRVKASPKADVGIKPAGWVEINEKGR